MTRLSMISITFLLLTLSACGNSTTSESADSTFHQWMKSMTQDSCKDLHKVTGIDDLLFQMYNNIDNHCLFDIPTQELEAIWGLKIIDYTTLEEVSDDYINAMSKAEYAEYSKPSIILSEQYHDYRKNGKGIFIVKKESGIGETLQVNVTESYASTVDRLWGGGLDKGLFPSKLPKPKIYGIPDGDYYPPVSTPADDLIIVPENTVYSSMAFYWWINSDNDINKPFLEIPTGPFPLPASPTLYKNGLENNRADKIFE